MKKTWIGIVAAASLAIGAAACSQNSFESVAVTTNPSVVSGCEKIGDVAARAGTFDDSSAQTQLTRAAQSKGANTLLVASENADKGTAYRCSMPSVAGTGRTINPPGGH